MEENKERDGEKQARRENSKHVVKTEAWNWWKSKRKGYLEKGSVTWKSKADKYVWKNQE